MFPGMLSVATAATKRAYQAEGVKKRAGNRKTSRQGAKRQRTAKKLGEFEYAFSCALAPWRETVDFFTPSDRCYFHRVAGTQNGRGPGSPQKKPRCALESVR